MEVLMWVAGSLFTAAIVYAGLWLGWTTRDRVGAMRGEMSVLLATSPEETLDESITQEDFVATDLDKEVRGDWM